MLTKSISTAIPALLVISLFILATALLSLSVSISAAISILISQKRQQNSTDINRYWYRYHWRYQYQCNIVCLAFTQKEKTIVVFSPRIHWKADCCVGRYDWWHGCSSSHCVSPLKLQGRRLSVVFLLIHSKVDCCVGEYICSHGSSSHCLTSNSEDEFCILSSNSFEDCWLLIVVFWMLIVDWQSSSVTPLP